MSTGQTPLSGPPIDVESSVERGSPGHWLTGNGATGDVAHLEISHDPYAEAQWVREYATGRQEFRDLAIESADQFVTSDQPAEAIASSRIALEIPDRGTEFVCNQGVVVSAMGLEDYIDEDRVKRLARGGTKNIEAAVASVDRMGKAMDEAFGTPTAIKEELKSTIVQGREAINGREIAAWAEAVNFFGERGELLAAGVGALELGAAYEQRNFPDKALETYTAAGELLKHQLDNVTRRENPARHTAEADEVTDRLVTALNSVVRLYVARGSVKDADKEILKSAVYYLDDLRAPAVIVQEGYEFLATNTHFSEKRFFKREATGIAAQQAVAKFHDENPNTIMMGAPAPRRDRRHRRPPADIT